jgi:hypothetical protein
MSVKCGVPLEVLSMILLHFGVFPEVACPVWSYHHDLDLTSTSEAWWFSNLEITLVNCQHWKNTFPDSICCVGR